MGPTGQVLAYHVTVIEDGRHRTIAEYRTLKTARMVARLAIKQANCTLATVNHRTGGMVYAVDSSKEWTGDAT